MISLSWEDELRTLLPPNELSEPDTTRLRGLSRLSPLAPLLLAVQDLTDEAVTAAIIDGGDDHVVGKLRDNGAAVIRELLADHQEDRQRAIAELLWGRQVPAVPAHAVIAVRSDAGDLGPRVDDALLACDRPDVVHLVRDHSGYLLAPAYDAQDAAQLCVQLHDLLRGPAWFAVAWRQNTEIEDGRQEASAVLDLVTCLGRPPGVYGVEDVVVEYAFTQDTSTLADLLTLIEPVVRQQPLRSTLEALVAAAGNRTKAAKELDIHRSTLEYRLGRIDQLTGHTPSTARGLQTLAAALTAYEVVHSPKRPA